MPTCEKRIPIHGDENFPHLGNLNGTFNVVKKESPYMGTKTISPLPSCIAGSKVKKESPYMGTKTSALHTVDMVLFT